ncbi:MAG: flagellar hook-length control protein FliK [Planctomycetaceae bacterium]|nr:flagellar hook-length control protein FliK [Planctomycetaceae bacterium]
MDVTDSTANATGLSILSLGVVPNASATPIATPPAQFSQQLQALTAAIADPQQLAAGLLEQASFAQNATAADGSSSAILAKLADLVARLLNDGATSAPNATPAVADQDAAAPVDESADNTDSDCCQHDASETSPVTEVVAAPPTVLSAALLQTLTIFIVDPHKSVTPVTAVAAAHAPESIPATPIGLVQTLSSPAIAGPAAAAVPVVSDVRADSSQADVSDEQQVASEIITGSTAPSDNVATGALNIVPSLATLKAPGFVPSPVKPTGDTAADTNTVSPPTSDVSARPSVDTKLDLAITATLPVATERPTPPEPASPPHEAASPTEQRWSAPTSSNSPASATDVSPPEPRTLPPHDATRLVQRLGQYVVEARDAGRQLSVQITPPDLGPLHIEVGTHNGLLTARLETNSTVAQQLLQEHLPQLHEALQRLGAIVERIDVVRTEPLARDRSNGTASGGDWSATSGQSSPDRRDEPRRPSPQPPRSAKVSNASSPAPATGALQELNIRI